MFAFCAKRMPKWNPISISGYHIREAGSTAAQEIAFTLADGIAYVDAALEAGLDVDAFAGRLSFFFNVAQQLPRGGREVPRRPPAVGAHHEGALQGEGPALDDAALPRADRRLARSPRSSPTTTSCGWRSRRWRRCWAARSRCTPTRATRRSALPTEDVGAARAAHAADHRLRVRRGGHHRSARRHATRSRRSPTSSRRGREDYLRKIDEHGRHGAGHREGLPAAGDPGGRLRLRSGAVEEKRAGGGGRERVPGRRSRPCRC